MLIFMEWKCCEPDDPPGFTSMPGVMSVNMRFGRICVLVFLAMTLLGSGSVFAAPANPGDSPVEKRPEGFDTPELSRSRFLGWIRRDLSRRIPGEETLIKQYLDEWKFQFETLTINKRIFAINIDVDNKYPIRHHASRRRLRRNLRDQGGGKTGSAAGGHADSRMRLPGLVGACALRCSIGFSNAGEMIRNRGHAA